jgi:hypothetical protein
MTPVCVTRDVTAKGFRLAAHNADLDFGGSYSFNWAAIEESPGVTNSVPLLDRGLFPPVHVAPFRTALGGKRSFQDHVFFFPKEPVLNRSVASVQLTTTDQMVSEHSVAAVGIVYNPFEEPTTFDLAVHNTDISAGGCAFNWITFSYTKRLDPAAAQTPEPAIETGAVAETWFERSGQPGDWRTWDISFRSPFAAAPTILVTANKAEDIPVRLSVAVLGMVQAVTPWGFRLAARNADLGPGLAGFHWIAIGQSA